MAEFLERLTEAIGPEAFNKLLRSLAAAEERGRLLYWQEQLVEKLAVQGLELPSTLPGLLELFAGVEPLVVPLARADFLADPSKYWLDPDRRIPLEWRQEAVREPRMQRNLFWALERSVSKVGSFDLATDALFLVASVLSPEEAVALYRGIRDGSGRLEEEWRAEFVAAFPAAAQQLPPARTIPGDSD